MSLLRLLTSGKTLIGLKRSEGRYRLPGGRVLPSFGSKKNPFRATVFPEKADEGPSAAEASSPEGGAESGISSVGNGDGLVPHKDKAPNTDPTSCASASSEAAETREAVQAAPVPARRGGALRALLLWSRVRKPKLQVGFKGRSLVQTELSLESVKVVRNDLTESDLEVVQAGSQPRRSRPDKPACATVPEPEASVANWNATGGQLLSAEKM